LGTQEMFYISSRIKEHKLFCSIICVLRYTYFWTEPEI